MEETAYLENAWVELEKGISEHGHPFRFCTLATLINRNEIKQRTLVLRRITEDRTLIFYTDFRSDKVTQVFNNAGGSLLFYHHDKSLQLSLQGKVSIHTKDALYKENLERIDKGAVSDYNTVLPPGTTLKKPMYIERDSRINFCILEFRITSIDYLQLHKDSDHTRLIFNRTINTWQGDFVVP